MIKCKKLDPKHFPICEEWIVGMNTEFTTAGWMLLHSNSVHAVIVNDTVLRKGMNDSAWIVNSSQMRPSFTCDLGDVVDGYLSYPKKGVTPLVITQESLCYHASRVRLVDEFVLLYDLRTIERIDGSIEYYQVDESGEDTLVAKSEGGTLSALATYVKEYVSIKKLNLLIQYDAIVYSPKAIEEFGGVEIRNTEYFSKNKVLSYSLMKSSEWDSNPTCACIRGKVCVRHDSSNIKRLWDIHENLYESFIVGKDKNGALVLSTCEESKLPHIGNWDGTSPWQMSFVFFNKKVLDKYYSNSRKYSVQDGYISGPEWGTHIDTDRKDNYVIMVLKDLGRMPYKEQTHWKQFNIDRPENVYLSGTTYSRWIEGQSSETKNALDLCFKKAYNEVCDKWQDLYGFPLFIPLAQGDQHYFDELCSMSELNNDATFDNIVLSFTKITIDSLNEKRLLDGIDEKNNDVIRLMKLWIKNKDITKSNITGGIRKLEAFMYSNSIYNEAFITLLNKLQALRSTTTAHRKTTSPKKADKELAEWFGIDKHPHKDVVDYIFLKFINSFSWLTALREKVM